MGLGFVRGLPHSDRGWLAHLGAIGAAQCGGVLLGSGNRIEGIHLSRQYDRGRLLVLAPADEIKEIYGADTLEEAFFAATGRSFEEEVEQDREEVTA